MPASTAVAISRAITALPVEKTGVRVSSAKGVVLAVSACPAHRSTTGAPSIIKQNRAPTSFSPSGASVKLAAKASFTDAKRGSQTPWMSRASVMEAF